MTCFHTCCCLSIVWTLVPPVILSFWAASPSLIQAINSSLAGSSFIQIAIFYCHNDILQILNISGGDLIWTKKIHTKKLSKARIVARHSFPHKWHLKSNDFFLFCGQEYLIHFSFQQCTKSSCKEMEGKEMTPLFRIWVRDVVYSLIPCWLFVINTTPLHSWSCFGAFTNYVLEMSIVCRFSPITVKELLCIPTKLY